MTLRMPGRLMRCKHGARRFMAGLLVAVSLAATLVSPVPGYAAERTQAAPVVFAAASLRDLLTALAGEWEARSGQLVTVAYAGTSTLARQLERGAPADVFISADRAWVDYLSDGQIIKADSVGRLARNELVLIAPAASAANSQSTTTTVAEGGNTEPAPLLQSNFDFDAHLGTDGRLAMAHPDHVPAGRYGREALSSLGRFADMQSRLTYSANVRLALALVARGETPLGIVYASDARAEPAVRVLGRFAADSHTPIEYLVARVTASTSTQARAFSDWLLTPEHEDTLADFGFLAP